MTHAQAQLFDRTLGTNLRADALHRIALTYAHKYNSRSVAVLLAQLPTKHICPTKHANGLSNGNQLWAICREGRLVTTMLRRADQPATPKKLRVDVVTVA